MPCKHQVLLQILVPSPFIERTSRDHLITFRTIMLLKEKIAIEGEEGDFGTTAKHYYTRDVVNSGTL